MDLSRRKIGIVRICGKKLEANMRKYFLNNEVEYKEIIAKEINLDHSSKMKVPKRYPCIVVIAYLGEGWDELCFIYQNEFKNTR